MKVASDHAIRYAEGLTKKFTGKILPRFTTSYDESFDVIPGQKFDKIVHVRNGQYSSVHAFVDADGNVYKPAGWKAPAKGIRYSNVDEAIAAADPFGGYLYMKR